MVVPGTRRSWELRFNHNLQSMALGGYNRGSQTQGGPRQTGAAIPVYQQKQLRLRDLGACPQDAHGQEQGTGPRPQTPRDLHRLSPRGQEAHLASESIPDALGVDPHSCSLGDRLL